MWSVLFAKTAQKDAKKLKGAGLDGKAKALLAIVAENPFQNPPAYEKLVGNLSGLYSRRISLKHRLVYEVLPPREGRDEQGVVKVLSMWTHYEQT